MKTQLGAALLLVASILIFAVAGEWGLLSNLAAGAATLIMAAGALLIGVDAEEGRPV